MRYSLAEYSRTRSRDTVGSGRVKIIIKFVKFICIQFCLLVSVECRREGGCRRIVVAECRGYTGTVGPVLAGELCRGEGAVRGGHKETE